MKKLVAKRPTKRAKKSGYPRGWNEKRVKGVIDFYDRQTQDEELAEYEAAMELQDQTMLLVPTKLLSEIRDLIARRQ